MSQLVITIGCSGSGKSYVYEKGYKDFALVCPDDIRKEITGNVSDQSRNRQVWEIAYRRLAEFIEYGKDVYFSATNCRMATIREIVKIATNTAKEVNENLEITLLTLRDSFDVNLCIRRVQSDIANKVDRSNTLNIDEKTGLNIIEKQHQNFMQLQQYFNTPEFRQFKNQFGIKEEIL